MFIQVTRVALVKHNAPFKPFILVSISIQDNEY